MGPAQHQGRSDEGRHPASECVQLCAGRCHGGFLPIRELHRHTGWQAAAADGVQGHLQPQAVDPQGSEESFSGAGLGAVVRPPPNPNTRAANDHLELRPVQAADGLSHHGDPADEEEVIVVEEPDRPEKVEHRVERLWVPGGPQVDPRRLPGTLLPIFLLCELRLK